MVTKDQIQLVVSGKNETGRAFRDVSDDIKRLRAEAAKPISLARVEQGDRDRLAGFTRGLRRAGDSAEERVRRNGLLPGRGLSASDLITEQNDRFRSTAGTGGGARAADGGVRAGEVLAKLGKGLVITEAVFRGIEMVAGATDVITESIRGNYDGQVKAAGALKETIGDIPIIGQRILKIGEFINRQTIDRVTGEMSYVAALKQATAEQEKQIARMVKANAERVKANEGARGVAGRVGSDAILSPTAALQQKIVADRKALAESLKPLTDKKGGLTETGKGIQAEGEARIRNDVARLNQLELGDRINAKAAIERVEKESADRVNEIRTAGRQAALRADGKALQAEIELVRQAAGEQIKASNDRFAAETASLAVYSEQYKAALKRNEAEVAAINADAATKAKMARQQAAAERLRAGVNALAGLPNAGGSNRFGPTPFSGESKLLTGVGSTSDPLLQENKSQTKVLLDVSKLTAQQSKDISSLLQVMTAFTQSIVVGGPL